MLIHAQQFLLRVHFIVSNIALMNDCRCANIQNLSNPSNTSENVRVQTEKQILEIIDHPNYLFFLASRCIPLTAG